MEESAQKNLILICEGGAHTVEYFHRNRVYPTSIVLTSTKFREMMPYLTKQDEVLVLIKGLTDFSMAEVYALMNDLEEAEEKISGYTIMSNVELGRTKVPYYLYAGDLFYGTVKQVYNDKIYAIQPEESEDSNKNKKSKKESKTGLDKKPKDKHVLNPVIKRYKVYNKRDVRFQIYGSEQREVEKDSSADDIVKQLVNVDLFTK